MNQSENGRKTDQPMQKSEIRRFAKNNRLFHVQGAGLCSRHEGVHGMKVFHGMKAFHGMKVSGRPF